MNAAIQRFLFAFQLFCALSIAFWLRKSGVFSSFGLALFFAVPLVFLFQFALIGIDFVLSRIHSGQSSNDQPATTGSVIKAWLRESIDCIRVFSFKQVFLAGKPYPLANAEITKGDKIPVLFLHGLFCNRALWHGFAKVLTDQGHTVMGISMEPAFGSIDEYPAQIDKAIRTLLKQTGGKKVALVGHSMGGLAARNYCRQYGDRQVEKIITLGTPHQGTWIARYGHGINVKQMMIQSDWLQQLAKTETEALGKKTTVILTDQDNIVFPQLVQTIPGATTIRVTGMGHISMVFDRKVQDIVRAVLA
jgi:predicted alpha/beta hydrolase family esterase